MNEDHSFKKLKGLTKDEAMEIYEKVYKECAIELEVSGDGTSNGVPITMLRERCNPIFKPYGWTYEKLFPWDFNNFS